MSTDRECAWEARSESDWLAISDSSGRGDGSMRYTAAGNPAVSERRGAVVVNGVRVEIGQAAAACAFSLDRSQQSIGAGGGRLDVAVTAQAACAWTARTDAPWIAISSGAAGQGSGTVSLSISPNAAAQARSSVVTIAGQPYLVEQAGAAVGPTPGPAPPNDPNCVLTVSPMAASVGAEGGSLEVRVTASAPTCSWTAVSGVPWIVMEGGVGETGSGSRRFTIAPNTTSESRVGNLGIAGAVVAVTQAAGSAPAPGPTPPPPPQPPPPPTPTPCTFSVSPTSASFPATGDAGDITVTASGADCAWTAASAASWITIQGASGATGSGRVRIV
ncbi:MAG TPA: BACON domain-containing carbohydrate-binding protein, partial [Vicinamibacterales bacterium]|nr:BACON domain-containing carbohydrate-binding protein [Vicinamibacterales bacterium]